MREEGRLRDALRGWLPDEILDRPKQGFEVPIADWFRGDLRELRPRVLLDPRRGTAAACSARGGVRELLDRHGAARRQLARCCGRS